MKIERHYRPEVVASKDDTRFNLSDPYLDVEAERVVATDGFRLVAVPVEVADGEVSGYLSRDLLKVGRKQGDKVQRLLPVEIKDKVEIVPRGIEWPTNQERKFPNWRAVLPPFREGDSGTLTIGLNARLLRGIADALGSEGMVALTVLTDAVGTAPIVVRALGGDRGEVGILMPCRVDSATGKVAAPAPVVDLPPTEAEKRKAAKEAGRDEDEPDSMDLPGVPPAIPDAARLTWHTEQPGLHAASVPTGRYQVRSEDRGWTASWNPWNAKAKVLQRGVPEPEAADACARHNIERLADALLKNAGAGDLTKADTKGAAVARKPRKGGR